MKRSEIDTIIDQGAAFIRSFGYVLPPFADWSPDEFARRRHEAAGVIDGRLGWDITDFGSGRFAQVGLFLFTVRNGRAADLSTGRGMLYAEKIMLARRDQLTPTHRHVIKAEDIINRGGGTLALRLNASDPSGGVDHATPVSVATDGVLRTLPAGGTLQLAPGESVTLLPGLWHSFWAEGADVLIGEVSTVNDDLTDNIFAEAGGRFPSVEEDVPPRHLLVTDY
jgi:hypothetical protein